MTAAVGGWAAGRQVFPGVSRTEAEVVPLSDPIHSPDLPHRSASACPAAGRPSRGLAAGWRSPRARQLLAAIDGVSRLAVLFAIILGFIRIFAN
ncbi:hypothetical protein [Muricoccus pecuniae]|uniref:Uncharacterized protein n=1 Tax=Muricoccus pecuniae TaxID=693023 RepID=A0A840YII3_9PROT|nr:hypothetical protein [Roseomonas pecuniae]MBB5693863.1 hypothetical protein [Roseomonas pecuniae]